MATRTYEFNWDIIGDLQEGRPNLGGQVNLILYRVMQYTFHEIAVKQFGNDESNRLFYEAGNIAGRFFFDNFLVKDKDLPLDSFLEKLRAVLDENCIRFLRIDSVNEAAGEFAISVAAGFEGDALDAIKLADCDYDNGFVEGVLFKYAGKDFKAKGVNTRAVQDIIPKLGAGLEIREQFFIALKVILQRLEQSFG